MRSLAGSIVVSMGMKRREVVRMNLDSLVKQGRLPWRPNAQAEELEIFHQYEIPLTGTFRMGDSFVLFTLIMESEEDTSVWAYVELRPEVARTLPGIEFESLDSMDEWVDAQFLGREAVFTIAREDKIGSHWGRQRVEENLLDAAETFLNAVIKSIEDVVSDPGTRVRAKIAGVDAARSELPAEALRRALVEV
jgi:hypothetical protein